jgi:hypothetical protein
MQEIATTVGCHATTVRRVVRTMLSPQERGNVSGRKPRVVLTPAQQAELGDLYESHPEITLIELARRFNIDRSSVSAIVRRRGVELRRRPIDEGQRTRMVELYRRGTEYSVQEIAAIVGCDARTVHQVLGEMLSPEERRSVTGRRPIRVRRKYRYRSDLFVEPLSDRELWLFGLLMADGSTDGRWVVRLALAARDRDAIDSARRVAGSDAPITVRANSGMNPSGGRSGPLASWNLHSREVVSRLSALGMVHAKSYREGVQVSPVVTQSPSFWRGLIDGDGSIYWSRQRSRGKVRTVPWLHVLGGRLLLEQWASFVVSTIGAPSPQVRPIRGTKILHGSVLTGSRAWDMLKLMYGSGGPALQRKRTVALEILAWPRPVPRGIAADLVTLALAELDKLALHEVPKSYVCPRTGVRLGRLLYDARRGRRRDLHELFERQDGKWRRG